MAPSPSASTRFWASSDAEDQAAEKYAAPSARCRAASAGVSVSRISPLAIRYVRSANATVRCARCSTSSTRDAALPDLRERVEHDVDDLRREPERRLVQQQHVGRGDERTGDRELLLLAARERAGLATPELATTGNSS